MIKIDIARILQRVEALQIPSTDYFLEGELSFTGLHGETVIVPVIQPKHHEEMLLDEYLKHLSHSERNSLMDFFTITGDAFWRTNQLSVIAVGTKTFPATTWTVVEEYSQRGSDQGISTFLENKGLDIDLIILCRDRELLEHLDASWQASEIIPAWARLIETRLVGSGLQFSVDKTLQNGGTILKYTIEADLSKGEEDSAQTIVPEPVRIKKTYEGDSVTITHSNGTKIHIRANLINLAPSIIDQE